MPMPLSFRPRAGLPVLLLLLGLGVPAALAQPVGPGPQAKQLTPEQQQKVFPEQRRLAVADRRARIAILQRGEGCLQQASTTTAMRECLRSEREAMREQRRQHMGEIQALYERNGLPAPQWNQRRLKPKGPLPGDPASGV